MLQDTPCPLSGICLDGAMRSYIALLTLTNMCFQATPLDGRINLQLFHYRLIPNTGEFIIYTSTLYVLILYSSNAFLIFPPNFSKADPWYMDPPLVFLKRASRFLIVKGKQEVTRAHTRVFKHVCHTVFFTCPNKAKCVIKAGT